LGLLVLGCLISLAVWFRDRRRPSALAIYERMVDERLAEIQVRELRMIAIAQERYAVRVAAETAYRESRSRLWRLA
jgi:hypothetical protein